MDAFELMGKVSRKGGGGGGGERGARGAGTRLCRARVWGLRACQGREPPERLLRDTAAREQGGRS